MTDPLCRHDIIVTWGGPDSRLWACAACSRRMYPACAECGLPDRGHDSHGFHPASADTAALVGDWQSVIEAAPTEEEARMVYHLSQCDWFRAALETR